MRILHLDPDDMDNPLSGGGPVRTFEICRRLARRHDITVLTPTFEGSTPTKERDGIRYVRLGRKIRNHGSSHHFTFLASLPRAIRQHEHDLLVEDFMPPCSATWTPWFRHRDRPLVASVQWFFADEWTRRLKLPFHWGQSMGVRWYEQFVVLTEDMRRTIQRLHPQAHCDVIPNGVDDSFYAIEPRAGDFMLYLGRIEVHAKGLDLLLRAMALLPEERRPRLVLAGSGTAQQEMLLQRWLDDTGMRPWVALVGHVNAEQRAKLLRDCRFTVMPSRIETFGMTIAEAHAAGKCAVIFDAAPMNEVASPHGIKAQAFEPSAFAAAMDLCNRLADADLLKQGALARQWSRRYDWDAVANRQEAFYLRSLESRLRKNRDA
jgi:phosphatidylinositol alpha-mannosyltransferase